MSTAATEVEKLIPFDVASGIFSNSDGRWLEGIGPPESVNVAYNTYYRTRNPLLFSEDGKRMDLGDFLYNPVHDAWKKYKNLEFFDDYMIPNGFYKSLANTLGGHQISLSIKRSRY